MYTDGETFYYRSDRPNRIPDRPRPIAAFPDAQAPRRDDPVLVDRLARLESRADQLASAVTQLSDVVQRLAARPPEVRPEVRTAAVRPEPVQPEIAEAERRVPEPEPAPNPVPGPAARAPGQGEIKVSVFAGGSTTAVLGQIRVQHEEA
jgi:hypothetical protein